MKANYNPSGGAKQKLIGDESKSDVSQSQQIIKQMSLNYKLNE